MMYLGAEIHPEMEVDLPEYLAHDLEVLKTADQDDLRFDCYWEELCGSINDAACERTITQEQAAYLRRTYLYAEVDDEQD